MKEIIYSIGKRIPYPIRRFIKLFYKPIIPETLKINYGQRLMPKENEEFILEKLREVLNKNVEGDVIEFSVYRGGSIIKFAECLKKANVFKKIYGLDTFEGLPSSSEQDKIPSFYKGAMPKNHIEKVKEVLRINKVDNLVILKKGLFKDSIPQLKNKRFCFSYVDCDLYEGTKEALEFLLPRMNKGGIIFLDDYNSNNWVGVKKAVLEILDKKDIIEYPPGQGYYVV